ncbi:MAG: integrin alpha [Planctomycetota bacterium]
MKPTLLLPLLLAAALPAQREHVVRWTGVIDNIARSGTGILVMGDLDKDGVDDYAVGGPGTLSSPNRAGTVELRSGATGKILRKWDGDVLQRYFGWALGRIADLDKDGLPDLIVGTYYYPYTSSTPPGEVQVFSTGTGKELLQFSPPLGHQYLGKSVAGIGDLNADGVPDILASSQTGSSKSTGQVLALSGKDGTVIHSFTGTNEDTNFGQVICVLPDLDNDGVEDIAIGIEQTSNPLRSRVNVFSGKKGSWLFDCGPLGNAGLVSTLISIPDMDNDKQPDLVVGISLVSNTGFSRYGDVEVWSTGTKKLLWRMRTPNASYVITTFGESVDWTPDRDGDGLPEILVGDAWFRSQGGVHVFGSKTRSLLQSITPPWSAASLCAAGERIAMIGDVDGNGSLEFIACCHRPDTTTSHQPGVLTCSLDPIDLSVEEEEVSLFQGGKQQIFVHAGPQRAGSLVLMLGTASGTNPGIPVGSETLFLNADSYFSFTLAAPLAVLWNNLSILDANGDGSVGFVLPTGLPP